MNPLKPIIIVGIHTNVGKTVVSAIVTEALQGYYWKPIQCGMPSDRDWVEARLSLKDRCYPERFCLKQPCSPHLAAEMEGVRIQSKDLNLPSCPGQLIIEGTGGLLSPLNETTCWADAAVLWDAHWILVHHHYLGSLNHFFLTIEAMRKRKLPLLGVIFNGEDTTKTETLLLKKTNTLCLGRLPWQRQLEPITIQKIAKTWRAPLQEVL